MKGPNSRFPNHFIIVASDATLDSPAGLSRHRLVSVASRTPTLIKGVSRGNPPLAFESSNHIAHCIRRNRGRGKNKPFTFSSHFFDNRLRKAIHTVVMKTW